MCLFIKRFFSIIIVLLFCSFLSYNSLAFSRDAIKVRSEKFALDVSNLVLNKARSCNTEAQFIKFLKDEIKKTVAINYMALWSLGKNKEKFSPEQFNRFILAFEDHLAEFYGSILYQSKDKNFIFKNSKSLSEDKATVEFIIPLGKQDLLVIWQIRLDTKTNKLLVTDFIVNGISFLQSKRSEYNAFFKNSGEDPEKFLNMFVKNNEITKSQVKNIIPK